MDPVHLPYTLITSMGMVYNNGLPNMAWSSSSNAIKNSGLEPLKEQHRTVILPLVEHTTRGYSSRQKLKELVRHDIRITRFQDYCEIDWSDAKLTAISETAAQCLWANRLPNCDFIKGNIEDKERYIANVLYCHNDSIDIHRLMTFIKTRKRLTFEQAAAAVVSAFVKEGRLDDAEALLREMTGVLAVSYMAPDMWSVNRNTLAQAAALSLAHAAEKAHMWCSVKAVEQGKELAPHPPRNYHDLVVLLLRVRCRRPKSGQRCLYIPRWLFDAAGIEPTDGHAKYLNEYQAGLEKEGRFLDVIRGYEFPQNEKAEDSIVVSKHGFRAMQRSILRMFRFWDPVINLRRQVRTLEQRVLYASDWIDKQLRETDDVAKIAFWFFSYQRRLQLKVVSDDQWTKFLAKGEGSLLYQNNLKIKSTFELTLARIAGLDPDVLSTAAGETLRLIDQTCLLMKMYVDIYGKGDKESLTFKPGVRGGSGRGPVDEYNMLCDILRELKKTAKDEGIEDVPAPVYKFLAKDIMSWNKSWTDDAFAGGKVHGWEDWVKTRKLV